MSQPCNALTLVLQSPGSIDARVARRYFTVVTWLPDWMSVPRTSSPPAHSASCELDRTPAATMGGKKWLDIGWALCASKSCANASANAVGSKKIVAIGKNYEAHAREMGASSAPKEPVLFLKPTTRRARRGLDAPTSGEG